MSPDAEGGSSPSPTPVANVSGGRSEGSRRKGGLTAILANPKVWTVFTAANLFSPASPYIRGLEKVLESLIFPCDNSSSGCSKVFSSHRDKLDHEGNCEFIPYYCPYTSCKFSGLYKCLHRHVTQAHPCWATRTHNTLFVCTRSVDPSIGTEVDVVCVGPKSAKGAPFSCDLTEKVLPIFSSDKDTPTLVNMKMGVECVQERTEDSSQGKHLLLPAKLMDDQRRRLELELIIRGRQA
ncbi:E3 ubiquitin-protein ligase [Striga asiatica]|uniref:E3 ubiquitin-protein ligase n=1 Tax=Striga asiatica TaxID=4170 RepID=A0A5A7QYZ2_STRAF|nr:E3 ubiquitin-protein ligase [Striga asiatica]